jgi:DNA-binding CsgD family transcriptional regulator
MAPSPFSTHDAKSLATRRAISELVAQGPASRELLDEVELRLRRVIPFDTGGWWTSDPETLLPTELWNFDYESIERELADEGGARLEILDAAGRSVAATSRSTLGAGARSPRAEGGRGVEMRILARSGESAWGAACLARKDDDRPFSPEEISFVAGIANEVGFALRADLLRIAMNPTMSMSPTAGSGTVVLSPDDTVEGYTPDAHTWLRQLGVTDLHAPLPTALRWISLQARAHALPVAGARPLRAARSRLATARGELIVVQAEVLQGTDAPKVVMSFEPATARSLFPLLLALHGLTARERTVAQLLVGGWTLEDVAAHLLLSLYTVRDHVKAIYAKVGVRSRPELTARLGGSSGALASSAA